LRGAAVAIGRLRGAAGAWAGVLRVLVLLAFLLVAGLVRAAAFAPSAGDVLRAVFFAATTAVLPVAAFAVPAVDGVAAPACLATDFFAVRAVPAVEVFFAAVFLAVFVPAFCVPAFFAATRFVAAFPVPLREAALRAVFLAVAMRCSTWGRGGGIACPA